MAAGSRIRIGVIGANPAYGWSPMAHLPALRSLPEFDLAAVCTAHAETARASAEKFGVKLAYHDYQKMLREAELTAVAIIVRVPKHYELAAAALDAGKHVFVEWPLGATLAETIELAARARSKGVRSMVGLQGRFAPQIARLHQLIAEGYAGEVVTSRMTQYAPGALQRPSDRTWQRDRQLGATTLTIVAGHALDYFCHAVGEFREVSAAVSTQVKQWHEVDTGRDVDVTAPDNVLVSGRLENGAAASVHVASVPWHGGGYRIQVFGRAGSLFVTQPGPGYGWISGLQLSGARSDDKAVAEIKCDENGDIPAAVPPGAPRNIARLYRAFARAIATDQSVGPDFDQAVRRYTLLDAIQRASDTGVRQVVL